MALSGDLGRFPIGDVLQLLDRTQQTGRLLIHGTGEAERPAFVTFYQGKINGASAPGAVRVGDVLVEMGAVDPAALMAALDAQAKAEEKRPLGQVLLDRGAVEMSDLTRAVERTIEDAVGELVTWISGTFEFEPAEETPIDEAGLYPGEIVPHLRLDTQAVLSEAMQVFEQVASGKAERGTDEHNAALIDEALDLVDSLGSGRQSGMTRLQVVSDPQVAEMLVNMLETALAEDAVTVEIVTPSFATVPDGADAPPTIIVVDLRKGGATLSQLRAIAESRPTVALLAMCERDAPHAEVYAAGAVGVVPPDIGVLAALVRRLEDPDGAWAHGRAAASESNALGLLRRDLSQGKRAAMLTLTLMSIFSSRAERGVLFLVRRNQLRALGAFGVDGRGRPLAEATQGLVLDTEASGVLSAALARGEVQAAPFSKSVPEELAALLGEPASGECMALPSGPAGKSQALAYLDNGKRPLAVGRRPLLELGMHVLGLVLEHELLSQRPQR